MKINNEPLQISFSVTSKMISYIHGNNSIVYPTQIGTMQYKYSLTPAQVHGSNIRFRELIEEKLESMPVCVQDFLDVLVRAGEINLRVSEKQPLTKKRLKDITSTINRAIIDMTIYQIGRKW